MIRTSTAWIAGAVVLAATACERRASEQGSPTMQESERPAAQEKSEPTAAAPEQPGTKVSIAGLGSCTPSATVVTAAERMASLADANGDGAVSRPEATALTNFLVGGAFFRADANADGTITPAEGRELREELLNRNPGLQSLLQASRERGKQAFVAIAQWADIEYGKPLPIAEARQAANGLVDDLFALVDDDKNGTIDAAEVRAAGQDGARAVGRSAFEAADRNKDGALTKEELGWLVEQPIDRAFELSDANRNGRLTMEEASAALQHLANWIGVPTSGAAAPPVKPTM